MRPYRTTNSATFSRRAAIQGMATAGAALATARLPYGASAGRQATPASSSEVVIPDTPIGREFASLIAAVNSHDPDVLLAYFEEYGPPDRVESMAAMVLIDTRPWGQVIVHRIDDATETRLSALIETTLSEEWLTVFMERAGEQTSVSLRPAEPLPGAMLIGPLDDATLAAEMMRYLDKLTTADVFSGAVLVARNGTPIFTGAYGMADIDQQIPNTVETRFNLGSMNKMFTSVTIGQLVEAGEMTFSDTIAQHLQDYPADVASKVKVEHLLTHTSGLGDIFGPEYEQR
ncbi:MAG TPA: serine hydrolase domain-containing protein, partial [Thermomicrobiales bacterium]|nr:serine hydrolase domain-containing protein [Thermomicrobiales bacterium]